jgi:hypothetical protein
MRSILFACAAALVFTGDALAQIELLPTPPDRQPSGRGRGGEPFGPTEHLFIAPSGEPFRAPPEAPYPVGVWFARADADHDGRLTLAEFTADALTFFDVMDVNHDGVVDGFEGQAYERTLVPELGAQRADLGLRPAPRRGGLFGGGRVRQVNAEGAALYGLLNEPQPVAGADSDLDRKISRAEASAAAQRRFRRLDADNDGVLTLGALPTTQAQMIAAERAAADRGPKPR